MLKRFLLLNLLFISLAFGGTINIAVAANVSYAIDTINEEFNKLYPDTKVRVILGSSGKLTAQIKNGAPYQLFMSANMKYPNALFKDESAITSPVVYAQGSLAYLSMKKQDFKDGIKLVLNDKISKIAIANPKSAPYGKAAVEALRNAKILDKVKGKFVYAESISQTVSYTVTATDLGFIAKSSLFSPKMKRFKKGINWADVDSRLYTPINQGIVILKKGSQNREVKAFYDFILSPKAKQIFIDFGYSVP